MSSSGGAENIIRWERCLLKWMKRRKESTAAIGCDISLFLPNPSQCAIMKSRGECHAGSLLFLQ